MLKIFIHVGYIDINMEDGDEMTVESTDQAPQAAVASTPKNNQTRRNPEQKHVTKSFDPYSMITAIRALTYWIFSVATIMANHFFFELVIG